ncbi:uncharacterized protein LOC128959656 [Oppia nitens]|uniref:uncharacterized protein LOC128959656 n=1 Tax=Oppia nitens TaxID=1686743 RepID=UPI0023DA42FA|nr:uncharacterized protein LOC128959656 [Oppia nitens]
MNEEEDEREEFVKGMETFLRGVVQRRNQMRDIANNGADIGGTGITSTQLGIEYRLIGCVTFYKSYRSPGVKVVCIPFIAVRTRYRRCGIGRFLLKRLKRPSQVGPYDALVLQADVDSIEFFRKNDFTDDIILNSRFRESILDDNGREVLPRSLAYGHRELMCYLPPFDGHYPPIPGTTEWNRQEVMTAIDDEVERWRDKSLEAYQSQWTCIARLQQEIVKLRSLLKKQESGIHRLRKENLNLQKMLLQSETQSTLALIEAWKKETANYG